MKASANFILKYIWSPLKLLPQYIFHAAKYYFFNSKDKPSVVLYLTSEHMGHQGRWLFLLIYFFSSKNKKIVLVRNIWGFGNYRALGRYGRLIFKLPNLSFAGALPAPDADAILVSDILLPENERHKWKRFIYVDYDIWKKAEEAEPKNCFMMPCTMHPRSYIYNSADMINSFRQSKRSVRLFFSGNTSEKAYSRNPVLDNFGLMSRIDIMNALNGLSKNKIIFLDRMNDFKKAVSGGVADKLLLADGNKLRFDKKWLGVLSRCDFFLCAPGSHMPYSHNAIEAMAVGAIPFINYPDWFIPKLEHGVNCIAFSDKADFLDKLELILKMDQDNVDTMRKNVIEYYQKFLAPESVLSSVYNVSGRDLTVFYNVENPPILRKLNGKSVIFNV